MPSQASGPAGTGYLGNLSTPPYRGKSPVTIMLAANHPDRAAYTSIRTAPKWYRSSCLVPYVGLRQLPVTRQMSNPITDRRLRLIRGYLTYQPFALSTQ